MVPSPWRFNRKPHAPINVCAELSGALNSKIISQYLLPRVVRILCTLLICNTVETCVRDLYKSELCLGSIYSYHVLPLLKLLTVCQCVMLFWGSVIVQYSSNVCEDSLQNSKHRTAIGASLWSSSLPHWYGVTNAWPLHIGNLHYSFVVWWSHMCMEMFTIQKVHILYALPCGRRWMVCVCWVTGHLPDGPISSTAHIPTTTHTLALQSTIAAIPPWLQCTTGHIHQCSLQ